MALGLGLHEGVVLILPACMRASACTTHMYTHPPKATLMLDIFVCFDDIISLFQLHNDLTMVICDVLIWYRCQRIKTEFTFEYNYLEDELIV